MSTLLIKNISQLVTCDDSDRVLTQVDILCKDGFIEKLGPNLDATAIDDQVLQGRDYGRGFWAQQWLGLRRLLGERAGARRAPESVAT